MYRVNGFLVVFAFVLFSPIASTVIFDNVEVASGVKVGDVIKQGVFSFKIVDLSAGGGVVLKASNSSGGGGVDLVLNPSSSVFFEGFKVEPMKSATGIDLYFKKMQVAQLGQGEQVKQVEVGSLKVSKSVLEVNLEAVSKFNEVTSNSFKDFNFRTKTKKDVFIVSAWKKFTTPASSKYGISSYSFFRGVVMCIDRVSSVVKCHFETN